jgi:hypothetical protein
VVDDLLDVTKRVSRGPGCTTLIESTDTTRVTLGTSNLSSCVKVSVALTIGNEDANLILDILDARAEGEVAEAAAATIDAQTCNGSGEEED